MLLNSSKDFTSITLAEIPIDGVDIEPPNAATGTEIVLPGLDSIWAYSGAPLTPVSYTHLRDHETRHEIV